jgi:hypothetical protein
MKKMMVNSPIPSQQQQTQQAGTAAGRDSSSCHQQQHPPCGVPSCCDTYVILQPMMSLTRSSTHVCRMLDCCSMVFRGCGVAAAGQCIH